MFLLNHFQLNRKTSKLAHLYLIKFVNLIKIINSEKFQTIIGLLLKRENRKTYILKYANVRTNIGTNSFDGNTHQVLNVISLC